MKRNLFLIIFSLMMTNVFAQHISFLGIQLGQPQSTVDKLLRQKGFQYMYKEYDGNRYEGTFWNYSRVSLLARTYKGKVTEILVNPSEKYNTMSDFNNLVKSLSKKYGKYKSIDDKYNGNLVSYNWSVKGGCIQSTYSRKSSGDYLLVLRYIDISSQFYVNPKGSNSRNRANDL